MLYRCAELKQEKEMATHSRIPAWKIPWTEEPGRLYPGGGGWTEQLTLDLTLKLHFQHKNQ